MRGLVLLTLITGLAACSDDDKPRLLPDAPPPPDAPMVDAPTSGVVTLTITDGTTPIADIPVIFQNADSSVVTEAMTDASGVAMATMEPGGYVTAINPFGQVGRAGVAFQSIRTFAGVEPGDQLSMRLDRFRGTSFMTNVQVPVDAAASQYFLWGSCLRFPPYDITNPGGSASPGPGGPTFLDTNDECATGDFIVETVDSTGGSLNAFYLSNVTVTPDGNTDLTGGTYAATIDASFSYSNVPAAVGDLETDRYLVTARGPVFSSSTALDVSSGAGTATMKGPVVAGALGVVTTKHTSNQSRHYLVDWGPATSAYELDFANLPLADYTERPSFDATTHAVTWTADAGAAPEFVRTAISFFREVGTTQFWDWEIVAPHGGSTVVLPVLPGAAATYNPIETDTADVFKLDTGKVTGGYDAIRAQALNLPLDDLDFEATKIVSTATGRAQIRSLRFAKALLRPFGQPRMHVRSTAAARIRR